MQTYVPQPTGLQTAAMDVFAQKGYAAASLRIIAQAAGIRASSIYSHFSSKDDLFLSLIPIALAQEEMFATEHFRKTKTQSCKDAFIGYLRLMPIRQKESAAARFVLAVKYFAPLNHSQSIAQSLTEHLQKLSGLFSEVYQRSDKRVLPPYLFAESFLASLESLESDLIYTSDTHFTVRLSALEALLGLAFGENSVAF